MRLVSFYGILLLSGCFTTVCISVNAQDEVMKKQGSSTDIDLWQNGLPNTDGMEAQGYNDRKNSFKPSIRVYLSKAPQQPARAVIICPGDGYRHLAMAHEGYDWAPFLNEQGIATVVLEYRIPNGSREVLMSDACKAIRYTKEHASEWDINPDCVGIMGFSAGGHLASIVAMHASEKFRPAFQILFYPIISMGPKYGHGGSCRQFLGEKTTEELRKEFSSEYQVDSLTPRAFIALFNGDRGVVPMNSIRYYSALKEKEIPTAMYIYPGGEHGWEVKDSFKFRNEMLVELKAWLTTF